MSPKSNYELDDYSKNQVVNDSAQTSTSALFMSYNRNERIFYPPEIDDTFVQLEK